MSTVAMAEGTGDVKTPCVQAVPTRAGKQEKHRRYSPRRISLQL